MAEKTKKAKAPAAAEDASPAPAVQEKQDPTSCYGCEFYYDSDRDPAYVAQQELAASKGARAKPRQRLCTADSPSVETGGKKLDPCPAAGRGVSANAVLTPEEQALIQEHRAKKAKGK